MNSFSTMWVGSELGPYEKLSLQSAISTGKKVTLYSYEKLDGIPDGVIQIDASSIMPRTPSVERILELRKFSGFANIFRYQLLSQKPTVWFDLDIVFLTNHFPSSSYIFAYENSDWINSAVLAYPHNSELANLMIKEATIEEVCNGLRGATGPRLLTKSVNALALQEHILQSDSFYPIHWSEPWKFFHPRLFDTVTQSSTNSYAVHLWNDVLNFSGLNMKTQKPAIGSFMENLFLTYNCEMPDLPPLPVSEIDRWNKSLLIPRSKTLRILSVLDFRKYSKLVD
jgi:hypothetical protein